MTVVLYPGSFDPVHNGHVELVQTASGLFDRVIVAAMRNPSKGEPLLSLEEREQVLNETFAGLENVTITMFSSLVVDLAQELEADFIVKGLRAVSDFESELLPVFNRSAFNKNSNIISCCLRCCLPDKALPFKMLFMYCCGCRCFQRRVIFS